MAPSRLLSTAQASVALNGFCCEACTRPSHALHGVALSRPSVHNMRPEVMYVPTFVQKVGRWMTMRRPREPATELVDWR